MWIPFGDGCSGDYICIDLDPDVSGTVGQVIEMWHEAGDRPLLAHSLQEYLEGLYQGLLTGHYRNRNMNATITVVDGCIDTENLVFYDNQNYQSP